MKRNDLTTEQKKLVWRYVEVWRRFRRLPDGYRSFATLEDDLARGPGMFLCGLLVDAEASTVIFADVKDPKFHAAIFGNDNGAVLDMTADELQRVRRYIVSGEGTPPVRLWRTKPPLPALIAGKDTEGDPSPNPPVQLEPNPQATGHPAPQSFRRLRSPPYSHSSD
jgi:hypothetical protein